MSKSECTCFPTINPDRSMQDLLDLLWLEAMCAFEIVLWFNDAQDLHLPAIHMQYT